MTRKQAEDLLSLLRTYENACAADMEREWCEAKYVADMADYDERNEDQELNGYPEWDELYWRCM